MRSLSIADEADFRMSADSPVLSDSVSSVGYTWGGGEVDAESNASHAKVTVNLDTKRVRHWIKFGVGGRCSLEAHRMYNPLSPTFNNGEYEYRPVKQEAFDLYLNFLKTQNLINLRNAERVI